LERALTPRFADYLLNPKRGWAEFTQDVAVSAFSRPNWAQMPFLSRLQACRIQPFTGTLARAGFHLNNNEIKRLAAQCHNEFTSDTELCG
jgi:hypothetical protein